MYNIYNCIQHISGFLHKKKKSRLKGLNKIKWNFKYIPVNSSSYLKAKCLNSSPKTSKSVLHRVMFALISLLC